MPLVFADCKRRPDKARERGNLTAALPGCRLANTIAAGGRFRNNDTRRDAEHALTC